MKGLRWWWRETRVEFVPFLLLFQLFLFSIFTSFILTFYSYSLHTHSHTHIYFSFHSLSHSWMPVFVVTWLEPTSFHESSSSWSALLLWCSLLSLQILDFRSSLFSLWRVWWLSLSQHLPLLLLVPSFVFIHTSTDLLNSRKGKKKRIFTPITLQKNKNDQVRRERKRGCKERRGTPWIQVLLSFMCVFHPFILGLKTYTNVERHPP